jgi:hypothetical protein
MYDLHDWPTPNGKQQQRERLRKLLYDPRARSAPAS